ncbi:DNA-3-methyladenine glycosylase family protein [uncultured Hymenobacter sp.]|uniref:DNA-3-methyladenine glycosylase family protein n=1 Tax=uncultured Hymenobacter sp. TaxID=170016 RepID=UPI0035C9A424
MSNTNLILRFTGDYSLAASVTLAASASFVDKLYGGPDGDGLDLALLLEGSWRTVGVRLYQAAKQVRVQVLANPGGAPADDIRAQLERMLCLDVDGAGFAAVAARDKVVDALRQQHPGLRPVLFPSPYEAAARAIIGHQLPLRQAAAITGRIAAAHGVRVEVGDRVLPGFPAPDRLAELPLVPGLAARKVEQLRALGQAAPDWLNTARLRALDHTAALAHLQQLAGIGPFSAELILIRGVGDPDAFPRTEKRLHHAMAAAYHLGEEPALDALERAADQWRPYRSWAGLLLRNSSSR